MNNKENIKSVIEKASKKDYLYLFYFVIAFLLFGSLGVFDIVSNYIDDSASFSYFNLIIGIIFSLIAIFALIYTLVFLFKPNKLIDLDFKNQSLIINKSFNRKTILPFNKIYFFDSGENSLFNFVFKYGTLKIYSIYGECFKVRYLNNSLTVKKAFDLLLGTSTKNIYATNKFVLFFIRLFQYFLTICLKFVHHKKPKVLSNYSTLSEILKNKNVRRVLIIESKTIYEKNLNKQLIDSLNENGILFHEFFNVHRNPIIEDVNNGKNLYLENNCQAIIAIGGGSVIDASKAIASIVYTNKPLNKFKGYIKIHHKVPLLVAIPTTCGTGSETTFVSVITDENTKTKFEIVSNKITPTYAILDSTLLNSLPINLIASTSMDAFSHALESYLNITRTFKTKKQSLFAMRLIVESILKVKEEPTNDIYKANLISASHIAGQAFNTALVGPIHALAHALGGKYNLDHGYLNAILMPRFLRVYLFSLYKDMNNISKYCKISDDKNIHINAKELISFVDKVNLTYEFKDYIDELKREDIHELALKAYNEAHLMYPSKKFVNLSMYEDILVSLLRK